MPEKNEFRYTDFEVRENEDGAKVVVGTIIRYGDKAKLPWGTEEFKAGAFGDVSNLDVIANRMHQRSQPLARSGMGLEIVDDDKSMRAEVTLPDTNAGRDTAVEVANGLLRGLSLEFVATKDTVDYKTDHRVIQEAKMYGFGVVDKPAYPRSKAKLRWQEYREAHGLPVLEPSPPAFEPDEEEEEREEEPVEEPEEEAEAVPAYRFMVV